MTEPKKAKEAKEAKETKEAKGKTGAHKAPAPSSCPLPVTAPHDSNDERCPVSSGSADGQLEW